jgi:hypothetical protein
MQVIEKTKGWYRGRYVPPPPNDPDSSLVFISPGHYEQPILAKTLGVIGRFWLAHWKRRIRAQSTALELERPRTHRQVRVECERFCRVAR